MSLIQAILTGLLMGTIFGFALEKARVFEPGIIVGQMQMRNFIMLKVFLTAMATGALVIAALNGFGVIKLAPKATFYAADVIGGLVLGAGIALAGACPGTVVAQIGVGYRDALFTLFGGLAGAIAFSYMEPALKPLLLTEGPGKITFMDLTGIPYSVLAVGVSALIAIGLFALERARPWRAELGGDVDGDLGPRIETAPAKTALKPAREM